MNKPARGQCFQKTTKKKSQPRFSLAQAASRRSIATGLADAQNVLCPRVCDAGWKNAKGVTRMIRFKVNGQEQSVEVDANTPLLWVLRETLGLTGTKFGCGMAQCGACTVHLDGEAVRACVTPVSRAAGKQVVTIEGLSPEFARPLQRAWIAQDVPQCGYCQSGQIMAAAVLLREKANPTDTDINQAIAGNICRCGTYQRIRRAIHQAAQWKAQGDLPR